MDQLSQLARFPPETLICGYQIAKPIGASAMARVNRPNIIVIYAAGEDARARPPAVGSASGGGRHPAADREESLPPNGVVTLR